MKKCPFCNSDNLYFRFDEDGFDWDRQQALINVQCEDCHEFFGAWIGVTKIIKYEE